MNNLNIEYQNISKLTPYARNSRTHSDEQVSQIAASIREFGWTNPILIDEQDGIIAGHGRLMAAQRLNESNVPTIRLVGLTEAQKKAYVIADNKLALNAGWDEEMLAIELEDLIGENYNTDLLGFSDKEINNILSTSGTDYEGLTDEDEVPDVDKTDIKEGDMFALGQHRIICGDATDLKIWEKLKIEKGIICFTSPPYNLGDSIKLSGNTFLNKKNSPYLNFTDRKKDNDYLKLIKNSLDCSLSFCEASVFNLQPLAKSKRPLMNLLSEYSSKMIDIITWDKGHAAPQIKKGIMSSRYEWLFLYSNKNNPSRVVPYASWQGKFSNVYQAPPQKNNEFSKIHGATFPVHLPEFVVGDLMNKSRGLIDCFCGTGTSIIASEKLGRIGYGIEINPLYVDVTIQRWQNFTGQKAEKING